MRLWTLHPKYLDRRGLVALWREGLLALGVLSGRTCGYRNHPQLVRFRNAGETLPAIRAYLKEVRAEAACRGYAFDGRKIRGARYARRIPVKRGQLAFERRHLLAKLKARDMQKYRELRKIQRPAAHPLFRIVPGGVEDWERGGDSFL
jgi:hypothetical protein